MDLEENLNQYIACIKTKRDFNKLPIVKKVTELLDENPDIRIEEIIDYLIIDDGFNKDEKIIAQHVKEEFHNNLNTPEDIAVRIYNESRDGYRTFKTEDGRYTNLIPLDAKAIDYFEPKSIKDTMSMVLDLEVSHLTKGGYLSNSGYHSF